MTHLRDLQEQNSDDSSPDDPDFLGCRCSVNLTVLCDCAGNRAGNSLAPKLMVGNDGWSVNPESPPAPQNIVEHPLLTHFMPSVFRLNRGRIAVCTPLNLQTESWTDR